ncbi:MAG: serine/threonine-protein kinase [Planctomycetota bacterium]
MIAQRLLASDGRLGRFQVKRLIHQGEYCLVFECDSIYPGGSKIALKVLRNNLPEADLKHRFMREFEALSRLDHDSVVGVIDFGSYDHDGLVLPYIAMEYIDGLRLDNYFASARPSFNESLRIFQSIADGLQHIHSNGILHRDVKPSNILIDTNGRPIILDLGVAQFTGGYFADEPHATHLGQVVGTPIYMSPEQMRGQRLDARSDLFSLGTVMYETLGGQHPFGLDKTPVTQMSEALRTVTAAPLGALLPTARGPLERVIAKAIEPERLKRHGSLSEFRKDLENIERGMDVAARRPLLASSVALSLRRRPRVWTWLFLPLILIFTLWISVEFNQRGAAKDQGSKDDLSGDIHESADLIRRLIVHGSSTELGIDPDTFGSMLRSYRDSFEIESMKPLARAESRSAIARSFRIIGYHDDSLALYPIVISEYIDLYGESDRETLIQRIRFAKQLQITGDSETANQVLLDIDGMLSSIRGRTDFDLMGRFWYAQGVIRMQQCQLRQAQDALENAYQFLSKADESPPSLLLRVHALYHSARIALHRGEFDLANSTLETSLLLARQRFGDEGRKTLWIQKQLKADQAAGEDEVADADDRQNDPFLFGTGWKCVSELCD